MDAPTQILKPINPSTAISVYWTEKNEKESYNRKSKQCQNELKGPKSRSKMKIEKLIERSFKRNFQNNLNLFDLKGSF